MGVDVMASSYHLADQVYTTITVVQYPPFGTQFSPKSTSMETGGKKDLGTLSVLTRSTRATPYFQGDEDEEMEDAGSEDDKSNAGSEDDKSNAGSEDDESDDDGLDITLEDGKPKPKREPLRPDETPAYLIPHEYLPNIDALGKPRSRKNNWKIKLREGEHYFVDGVCGDPTELKNRFIWFETDNVQRYTEAQKAYYEIKERIRDQRIHWNKVESFYWNLYYNQNVGTDGHTAGQIWHYYWKQFISWHAMQILHQYLHLREIRCFWYVADTSLWYQILPPDQAEQCIMLQKAGMRKLKADHKIPDHDVIKSRLSSRNMENQSKSKKTLNSKQPSMSMSIRIPTTTKKQNKQPDLNLLMDKIHTLESRLVTTQTDRNTQHLLQQVLHRLEDIN
jgi:hypothetical protein